MEVRVKLYPIFGKATHHCVVIFILEDILIFKVTSIVEVVLIFEVFF